jgi:hypothetical protein
VFVNCTADVGLLDWETATASVVAPIPEAAPVEDLSGNRTPVSPSPRPLLQTAQIANATSVLTEATAATNMVLFVSLLSVLLSSSR